MKINRQLVYTLLLLLLPLVASASVFDLALDDFGSIVKLGLLIVFIIGLNIRAFLSNDSLPIALALNTLLLAILLVRTDEDNMVFNLSCAAVLLILGVTQWIMSKRRG